MATSSAMSTSNQYIKYTISITQNSQSTANNTSNVTVSVRFYRTNTGYESYGTGTVYCKINGTQYSASVKPSQKITNSGIVLFTKTLDISHGSDGKKTLTCSAWISHEVVTSSEQSYSQALSTIYRASTVSATAAKMGGTSTITINRKSSSFTHTLKYTFGGTTTTIATGVGTSYAWNVPDLASKCNNATSGTATITCITHNGSSTVGTDTCTVTISVPSETTPVFTNGNVIIGASNPIATNAGSTNFSHTITYSFNGKTGNVNAEKVKSGIIWWTPANLASAITSDTGKGTITCTTYNGTAPVGTKTIEFTGVVPNTETFQPTLSSFSISPSGSLPSAFSGLYIQGKTGVRASFTASSTYSTIDSYKLTADGKNFFGNPATSSAFTRDGNFTVTGIVTDKRGFTKSKSMDVTVIPYSKPTIEPSEGHSSIICERSLQDGTYDDAGTFLHIKCKRKYSPVVVGGAQKNFCSLQYQFKIVGGTWSSPATLLYGSDTFTNEYEGKLPNLVSQADKSYTIRLIVTDTIGSSETYEFKIATADVAMHLGEGGYGVAVGKYSEATPDKKMFEVAEDWDFVVGGEAVADFVVEQGTSGIWSYRKWASGKAECWGRASIDAAINIPWGNLYIARVEGISFPFTFSDTPICVYAGTGGTTLMIANNGNATPSATQPIVLIRPMTTENTTYLVQFAAYGKVETT